VRAEVRAWRAAGRLGRRRWGAARDAGGARARPRWLAGRCAGGRGRAGATASALRRGWRWGARRWCVGAVAWAERGQRAAEFVGLADRLVEAGAGSWL